VSRRSGEGLEAGGSEKARKSLRIIEEFDEMQLAQKVKNKLDVGPHGKRLPLDGYLALLLNLLLSLNLLQLT
jgi:hypothetical protein